MSALRSRAAARLYTVPRTPTTAVGMRVSKRPDSVPLRLWIRAQSLPKKSLAEKRRGLCSGKAASWMV